MRSWPIILALLAAPLTAEGQSSCPPGLLPVDALHCCWPGQYFSRERQACAGAPRCPPGLTPYGEMCVPAPASFGPAPELPASLVEQGLPELEAPPPDRVRPPAALPPAPPAAVRPAFLARFDGGENTYVVTVDGGAMCETPCSLPVTPGRHRLKITGDASFSERIEFPATSTLVKIERRRGGRLAVAVVGLSLGIPLTVAGGFVGLVGGALELASRDDMRHTDNRDAARVLMITGGTMFAVGAVATAFCASFGFSTAGRNRATLRPLAPTGEAAPAIVPAPGGAAIEF